MSAGPRPLALLRARVQRLQLILVLGFAIAAIGAVMAAPLIAKLDGQLQGAPSLGLVIVQVLLGRLWVLAVLPAVAYGAARLFPLTPWPTAIGLVVVGESFYVALALITAGSQGLLGAPWLIVARVLTDAVGCGLAALAIRRARRVADPPM